MKPAKTFEKEKVSFNLARLKKGGEIFEIVIDPDKILDYKEKKITDVKEILLSTEIFNDARKGLHASDAKLVDLFKTEDSIAIAAIILEKGEIQFTQEYRNKLREDKRKRIIAIITRNAIDPRTHLPHPKTRIENAFEEAKVRIDELKAAEEQIQEILSKLKPVLPIKFSIKEIEVKITPNYASKAYSLLQRFGKIRTDAWMDDGSWVCNIEIPAGMQNDFFDALNELTHGENETKIIKES